jgi:hypothetical protein
LAGCCESVEQQAVTLPTKQIAHTVWSFIYVLQRLQLRKTPYKRFSATGIGVADLAAENAACRADLKCC